MRKAVIELFQVPDTKPEDRDPYMEEFLAQFPYVNGGLFANEDSLAGIRIVQSFANEDIEIPPFTDEIRNLLLEKASADNGSENKETSFLLALIQDQLKIIFHYNIKKWWHFVFAEGT